MKVRGIDVRWILGLVAFLVGLGVACPVARAQGYDPPRTHFLVAHERDGRFQVCRLRYDKAVDAKADGDGWWVDYPRADDNLTIRLAEMTKVEVRKGGVIGASNPLLYTCPVLMITEPGSVTFSDEDVLHLRDYFIKGGFLWVDDFWGEKAWAWWAGQVGRILNPIDYPIVDVPLSHPIFHVFFDIKEIPQIPNIGLWQASRETSERGEESKTPHFRGISDERGRLVIVMTHNTDFGDAFEEEAKDPEYFKRFSVPGYRIGINILLYAVTH